MLKKVASFLAAGALLALPMVAVAEEAVDEGRFCVGVSLHPYSGTDPIFGYIGGTMRWYPHLRLGYDNPMIDMLAIRAGLSISNPLTPFHSWYVVDVAGKYRLTSNIGVLAGIDVAVPVAAGQVHPDADWTMFVGGHYAFGGGGAGLGIWLQGHIPWGFAHTAPLFGAYFSGGLEFRF